MDSKYIDLSHSMRDLIVIRGVIQEINDHVFNKVLEELRLRTHSKRFVKIHQYVVYEDNLACLYFATMPKISSQTKHIAILYDFFRSKVKIMDIKVVAIDTKKRLTNLPKESQNLSMWKIGII